MAMVNWIFSKTLNSVWFGIVTMLLIAAYVAVGSGQPRVREFFEMDELGFFNAWPLKLLMVLLVSNLVVVTFVRIPFTRPRYGVWMIHTGIVTLIFGMAYYYRFKQEGLAFVMKDGVATHYYDRWERALYVRVDGVGTNDMAVLGTLPRFHSYEPNGPSNWRMGGSDLKGIKPVVVARAAVGAESAPGGGVRVSPLHQMIGHPNEIEMDVVGYWPYAELVVSYLEGTASGITGVRVVAEDHHGLEQRRMWLVASEGAQGQAVLGELELEHREVVSAEALREMVEAVGKVHVLEVSAGGESKRFGVDVGVKFELGGYGFEVEAFDPAWRTMQGEVVPLLTVMVTPPKSAGYKEVFRRQLIPGREKVTDWKLGEADAGPMGKRQNEALDAGLVTRYTFNDSLRLLPREGREKRVFVTTAGEGKSMTVIGTSSARSARVVELETGKADLVFGEGADKAVLKVERVGGLTRGEKVVEVPKGKRDRVTGEVGAAQMAAVRVKSGGWEKIVNVPFSQWVVSNPSWKAGTVTLPESGRVLQLQLGNRQRPIAPDSEGRPASVRLDKFDLVSYAGGSATSGMQRDFKSSLTIKEGDGVERKAQAHMNNPVYFGETPIFGLGDTYWTLFQAQWDPNGQRFTVLGVGNRPGVWIMTAGCVVLTVGLMYAFYAKPLIVRRMKEKAIAEAKAKGKPVPAESGGKVRRPVVMEGVEGRISV